MLENILKSLVIVFGASALVVLALNRFRIPSLVGFLLAGIVIGPSGFHLVTDTGAIEILAEIGVVLLLFSVGLEFSTASLISLKRSVILGGGAQMALTIALVAFLAHPFMNHHPARSILFGFLLALSSTAIVFKLLSMRGELEAPYGRMMVGILIFQDLCVVPLMLVTQTLGSGSMDLWDTILKFMKGGLFLGFYLLLARWGLPLLLHRVIHTKSRELFMITIFFVCLGTALFTSWIGLSLALGAFLAGLLLAESEYSHQIASDLLPLKDAFMSLFFISIGMLLNLDITARHAGSVLLLSAAIIAIKSLTGSLSSLITGSTLRTSIQVGLGLSQVGEFSFVLASAARTSGLLSAELYQLFLSASIATMLLSPFLFQAAPRITSWIVRKKIMQRLLRMRSDVPRELKKKQGHVVIIGFGLNGHNLARVLREAQIPYVVLDGNSEIVRKMRKKGEPIYFGDGNSPDQLKRLGIAGARLMVIAISDAASSRRIVSIARNANPDLHIIVRTRYLAEVADLKSLGASEVIPEEFETSIEIFSRVLYHYRFPENAIVDMAEKIRRDNYQALRSVEVGQCRIFDAGECLQKIDMDAYRIPPGSFAAEKSLQELDIRKRAGVTVLAVRRNSELIQNPLPDFKLQEADVIFYTGDLESMEGAWFFFKDGDSFPPRAGQ